MADYDLAIIGGGMNGVCIARDAAGRGLRVILLEQGDLGSAASSASPRLIHGDLALLERRALLRVRAALAERDIWLRIAPHLVRPMRFAIPGAFRRAAVVAVALGPLALRPALFARRSSGFHHCGHHASSNRKCLEASLRHGFRIF